MTAAKPPVEYIAIDTLRPHPRNPRHGDIGAVTQMIAESGWHSIVTVQRTADSGDVCLAGWHRTQALLGLVTDGYTSEAGEHFTYEQLAGRVRLPPKGKVPVELLDIDDATALKKLLQDNRANDLADYDEVLLADLLRELAETDTLAGSGFDGDDVDELLRSLEAPELVQPNVPVGQSGGPGPREVTCPGCGLEFMPNATDN